LPLWHLRPHPRRHQDRGASLKEIDMIHIPPQSAPALALTRRALLQSAASTVLLSVPVFLPSRAAGSALSVAGVLTLDSRGNATITSPKIEMGQGTHHSIAMLLAEELDLDLKRVRVVDAPSDDKLYGDPINGGYQVTGSSSSMRSLWLPLRTTGARARAMLLQAAAAQWQVEASALTTEPGRVVHPASARRIDYGALVPAATALPVPDKVVLKDPAQFRLLGRASRRMDTPAKSNGSARFSIDVEVPGMQHASVAMAPTFGGKLQRVDDSAALKVPGVSRVVRLDDAVAVIAASTWAARLGRDALQIEWDAGPNAKLSSASIAASMAEAAQKPGALARSDKAAQAPVGRRFEASYSLPFLSHASMEPLCCTAQVGPQGIDIWTGTQVPTIAQLVISQIFKVPQEQVRIHNQWIGGAFGRRLEFDFIIQAVAIAAQAGVPVKTLWTREDDTRHDMPRPMYLDHIAATLGTNGSVLDWSHKIVGSSIYARKFPAFMKNGVDPDAVDGAVDLPYQVGPMQVAYVQHEPGFPTAFWRGVGPTHNVFVVESFIDQLAFAAGQDPVAFRRNLAAGEPRLLKVLDLAADKSNWGRPLPKGVGRGIAAMHAFGSYLACVVEGRPDEDMGFRVTRVVYAVDCGHIVNLDTVKAQLEGGMVYGLSAALWGDTRIADGGIVQSNFHDLRVLRMNEMPRVESHLVESREAPGGIGEPGTAVFMPALANAVFSSTGRRATALPLARAGGLVPGSA
jgi:isoquinoline 1-oxidoreductase subunit beta